MILWEAKLPGLKIGNTNPLSRCSIFLQVQGSLMVAAAVELILGITGIVGFLLRYIGPLAICPTVSLLGINFFKSAGNYGSQHWWICILYVVVYR